MIMRNEKDWQKMEKVPREGTNGRGDLYSIENAKMKQISLRQCDSTYKVDPKYPPNKTTTNMKLQGNLAGAVMNLLY